MTTFDIVKSELQGLGYAENLMQEKYVFDDATSSQTKELQIPLAAFAQWPPSYRNACIGVLKANGHSGPQHVSTYRSLGAPMFFEVYEDHIIRYRMEAPGKAIDLETIPSRHLPKAFKSNKDKWNPTSVFRAKAISPMTEPVQLDFIDAGFLPALKGMIHGKLDRLLRDTLHETVVAYKDATSGGQIDETSLFRLVFRFVAAKIFNDKRHEDDWSSPDARFIINKVQKFYGLHETKTARVLDEPHAQQVAWDRLRKAFNFQNLSVDDLAFIYENTLVRKETREKFGIHSTPSVVAELMVDRLPFEDLPQGKRFVLEPCSGHGVFLVAALRRLKDLLPTSWTEAKKHIYLKDRIKALEVDPFAAEVCRLSLTLADYPNPDGWKILSEDIFATEALEKELPKAKVVLCNPPFEDFKEPEKKRYGDRIQNVHKPYEVLRRVLENPPAMLGFVLPKSAIIGDRYRDLQATIAMHYTNVETVALPDRIFAFSDLETMLLLASKPELEEEAKVTTSTFWVREQERKHFLDTGCLPEAERKTTSRGVIQKAHKDLWNPPLWEIWDYLAEYPLFKSVADFHQGIQWSLPLEKNREILLSNRAKAYFKKGLDKVPGKIEPYWAKGFVYLNMHEDYRRRNAHFFPWEKPKVILNRHILRRSPWRIVGYPDTSGLVCCQNFIAAWPKMDLPIELLASLLNSPLLNAAIYANEGKRDIRIKTLEDVRIPFIEKIEIQAIINLEKKYLSLRKDLGDDIVMEGANIASLVRILFEIDSLILKAYDLPPRLERKLLNFFNGYPRPVPFSFPDYYPKDFQPCIPLHKYLEMDMKRARAGEVLKRIEPLDSEEIHEFVLDLEERQAG